MHCAVTGWIICVSNKTIYLEKSEKNFTTEVILSLSMEEKSQGKVGVKNF